MPNIYEILNDKVVGFEEEAQTIIDQLIHGSSKDRKVVLITGMGGLGKTTLAKRVYDENIVVNHFHKRVWCTISQEYDYTDLLNKIYNQVCDKEIEIGTVAEKLCKSLKGWRYLIVLDDIWSLKAWEELNRAFPECHNGSRIVLTSRQDNIVPDAKHIYLRFFTVDESWELLQVKLFKGKGCPKELENIGQEISKKCGGLPLVVGLVAGLLGGVERSEQMWQEVLNTLSSQVAFGGGIKSNDAIELSYNYLPDHLRNCLLYYAAFPEDEAIAASKLINLWISEGFIDLKEKERERERVEDVAEDFLNYLVGSNLVMVYQINYDGRILSCGVHDLVRDFCLTKAKEENFLHITKMENVLDPTLKLTPHRISFHRCSVHHEIPNELVPWNSSIRTLLGFEIFYTPEAYDQHIYKSSWVGKKFEHLTILDLEFIQVDISIMFEVNSLIHLRYLALKLCGSGSISPWLLENLECLVTLKLTSREDVHLPKVFWNMRSLRHMVIQHCCSKSCPIKEPSVMEPIPHGSEILQTLDLDTHLSIRDEHLLRKFLGLKFLRCAVPESYPFAEFEFLHHLEYLELCGIGLHLLNDLKVTKFPPNIKEIYFIKITLSSSAISIIARLSKLEALTLESCEFEEGSEWNVDEDTQFCKLKYLKLSYLDDLRIWNVSSAAESFPCLEQLILYECFRLEGLSYSFADISTLELISVVNGPDVDSSVNEIQEELQSMGNEQLTVHIDNRPWWSRYCTDDDTDTSPPLIDTWHDWFPCLE